MESENCFLNYAQDTESCWRVKNIENKFYSNGILNDEILEKKFGDALRLF
jgi:hypothetical protein